MQRHGGSWSRCECLIIYAYVYLCMYLYVDVMKHVCLISDGCSIGCCQVPSEGRPSDHRLQALTHLCLCESARRLTRSCRVAEGLCDGDGHRCPQVIFLALAWRYCIKCMYVFKSKPLLMKYNICTYLSMYRMSA